MNDKDEKKAAGGSGKRYGAESNDGGSWSSEDDRTKGDNKEREMRLGNEEKGI